MLGGMSRLVALAVLLVACGSREAPAAPSEAAAPAEASEPPECTVDADCDPRRPSCHASGTCVSCVRPGCSPELIAREIGAVVCERAMAGRPVMDTELARVSQAADEASICTGHAVAIARLVSVVRAGVVRVDVERFRACIAREPPLTLALRTELCDGLSGTLAVGATCGIAAECTSGRCRPGDDGIRRCVAPLAAGESCLGDWERNGGCADGLACDGTCRAAGASGDGCPCAVGLVCVGGTCRAPGETNAECTFGDDCMAGLVCSDGRCADPPRAGSPCATGSPRCGPHAACVDGRCVESARIGTSPRATAPCPEGERAAGTPSRCRPLAPLGGPCHDAACPHGTACTDGRCTALPDVGEPCTDACYRGTCTDGRCADLAADTVCPAGNRPAAALDPCGVALQCVTDGTTGRCRPVAELGAACDRETPCRAPALYCDPTTSRCVASMPE